MPPNAPQIGDKVKDNLTGQVLTVVDRSPANGTFQVVTPSGTIH